MEKSSDKSNRVEAFAEDFVFQIPCVLPCSDLIVSAYASGRVASRYGVLEWDWTPRHHSGAPKVVDFHFWTKRQAVTKQRLALVGEMKWLAFIVFFHPESNVNAVESQAQYALLLRKMGVYCEKINLSVHQLLADTKKFWQFVTSLNSYMMSPLASLCRLLARIGSEASGFNVPSNIGLKRLRDLASDHADRLKQHPPIPTRIYNQVLSCLLEELSEFDFISKQYLLLVKNCAFNRRLGRCFSKQSQFSTAKKFVRGNRETTFPALMEEYGLTQYFNNKKLADDVIGLVNGLQRIMYLASLTIQAFTGMRVSEVASLKIDCLKKHRTRGKTHYIIHGVTTKFNKGEPKQVKWVTNESGRYAVDIAAQITRLTHTILMEKSGEAIDESEVPLFASLKYLGIREVAVQRRFETRMVPMNLHPTRDRSVRQAIRIAIEEEDLCELEEIDAHRAWRSESKFAVGQLWILTGHQLRRSLALYAQRSGIVSLPSLRRQLQHITDEMTRYYAKGSAFAKNFIGDHKNHFATEWLATQPISAGISYVKHVLLSDDVKFGGHGNWIEKRIRGEERSIEADRQRTLDQFERGQISYRETPLGGCTNVDPCDKRPVRWWNIDCVKGCKFLVGRLSNLERIIVFQRKLVVSLDPTSAVFQAENADLDTLTATRDRVLRQAAKGN